MPPQAQEPDRNPAPRGRVKFPRGGPTAADKRRLREKLLGLRVALLRSSQDLAEEALKSSGQDFSVDHLADHGSDNFEQDVSLSLLEGETELLSAIETAMRKIDGSESLPYGLCEDCADEPDSWKPETTAPWISPARLEVVPYTPYCVPHQELREEG